MAHCARSRLFFVERSTSLEVSISVSYTHLNLYGLEQYYRYHTENGQGSYTDEKIVARPTALHLYIYLLERYYMGLPESECCKGTSGVLDYVENTEINLSLIHILNAEATHTTKVGHWGVP